MIRQTKRQRRECPISWMDCQSLERVPYLNHYMDTPVASDLLCELFQQRFQTEIIEKHNNWNETFRIRIEPNDCTELLEQDDDASSLVVLANDVFPPTPLVHFVVLAQQRQVPVLLVPSSDNLFGNVVMVFVKKQSGNTISDLDAAIDSFVSFILEKLHHQEEELLLAKSSKKD